MSRQHATPLLLGTDPADSVPLRSLSLTAIDEHRINEAYIRDLIFAHPSVLPIAEVDRQFIGAVAVCTELRTPAGDLDVLLITPSGLPVLVECKLWRNPEGRREVVGQILDYAKELSRFTSSDLQREASRQLGAQGEVLLDLVRKVDPTVDEADFNDALTQNLKRGRFLLLIVGDGIREGTEAIAEYLQRHAGLHFTLGLVEMPIFLGDDGRRFVAPRVLAHTTLITHTVVAAPVGYIVAETTEAGSDIVTEPNATTIDRTDFWTRFIEGLELDDPEQPRPKAGDKGNLSFMLPAPSGSCWLNVFRNYGGENVGVALSFSAGTIGERASNRVLEDVEALQKEIAGPPKIETQRDGRRQLFTRKQFRSLADPIERAAAIEWLQLRTNEFVNACRPRIRAAVADLIEEAS